MSPAFCLISSDDPAEKSRSVDFCVTRISHFRQNFHFFFDYSILTSQFSKTMISIRDPVVSNLVGPIKALARHYYSLCRRPIDLHRPRILGLSIAIGVGYIMTLPLYFVFLLTINKQGYTRWPWRYPFYLLYSPLLAGGPSRTCQDAADERRDPAGEGLLEYASIHVPHDKHNLY
jgi:hypothetical protein